MKIAMVISTPFPPEEGIGYYSYNLSIKLIERGHEVTIFTRGKFKTEYSSYDGIKIIKAPFLPLYPVHVKIHGFILNMKFKEDEFDLVHIHTPLTPILKTSLPVVSTIHGSMIGNVKAMEVVDLKSSGSKLILKLVTIPLVSKLMSRSQVVTTVSHSVFDELKHYYGFDDIKVIGNGVDEKKFIPTQHKGGYLLYVGRLSYGKGLNGLLESMKHVCKQYDLKLYIVGKGELEKNLKEYIKTQKLENYVKFLGGMGHDELVNIYQKAIIFIFPSHYEGFPTVVLEAMSSGLPVILSDIPTHKEFIENGINGILVKKGISKDLTKNIIKLYNDKDLRNKLGSNARKTVENRYTWDIISKKYEKIYLDLLR